MCDPIARCGGAADPLSTFAELRRADQRMSQDRAAQLMGAAAAAASLKQFAACSAMQPTRFGGGVGPSLRVGAAHPTGFDRSSGSGAGS